MTLQEFIDKYNGKGVDFDMYYGNQCMDLAQQYVTECLGNPILPGPNAIDCWSNYQVDLYTKVVNTPEGVPVEGDIVIWGQGVGQYGHIAVFINGDANNFKSFDQNWPLQVDAQGNGTGVCHIQDHNWSAVLGWLHPTPKPPTPPPAQDPVVTDQTKLNTSSDGVQEWQAVRSLLEDRKNQIISLDKQVSQCQVDNQALAGRIDILNKQVADLQHQLDNPPATIDFKKLPFWDKFKLLFG